MKKFIDTCKSNHSKGWKTSIIGYMLFSVGITLLIDQRGDLTSVQAYTFGLICLSGIGFIFSPDSLLNVIKKGFSAIIDKFTK